MAGKLAGRVRSLLPDPIFYRGVAAAYRLRPERRLLLLDEFVSRGSIVVDAGAWWGPWTYWLSNRAASVWAFEPNPDLASFLRGVVASNVHVENVALSNRAGTGTLFAPRDVGRDALAALSMPPGEATAERIEVPLQSLDHYRLEDVRFVKIDVEGHELALLEGAEATLERCEPALLIEIDQRLHTEPIQRIFDWLQARGYEGRFRRGGSWTALAEFELERDQPSGRDARSSNYVNDFLFTSVGA